jgi:hypothetical protein
LIVAKDELSPALKALLGFPWIKNEQDILKTINEILACRTKDEWASWKENHLFTGEDKEAFLNLVVYNNRLRSTVVTVVGHLHELGVA